MVWYNDAGGVTLGVRAREDYLGQYEQNVAQLSSGTGWGVDDGPKDADFFFRARNPVYLRAPNLSQTLDVYNVEGRFGATATLERSRRDHLTFGSAWTQALTLQWVQPDDFRYLDRGYYDDVGTVELRLSGGVATRAGKWQLDLRSSLGGGLDYHRNGLAASGRADLQPFYGRATFDGTAHRPLGARLGLAARIYAGLAGGNDLPPRSSGRSTSRAPIRSSGSRTRSSAPAARCSRARTSTTSSRAAAACAGWIHGCRPSALWRSTSSSSVRWSSRPKARLFSRVALAGFTDLAHAIGDGDDLPSRRAAPLPRRRGDGLRAEHRIGDTRFVTRLDLPLWVNRPELAQDASPGDDRVAFRWVLSFEPAVR